MPKKRRRLIGEHTYHTWRPLSDEEYKESGFGVHGVGIDELSYCCLCGVCWVKQTRLVVERRRTKSFLCGGPDHLRGVG